MIFTEGDKLVLQHEAINLDTDEIVFKKGAIAFVEYIKNDKVGIKFVGKDLVFEHDLKEIPFLFKKSNKDGKTFSRTIMGNGTPPKELFPYMPEKADWKNNYEWTFTVELKKISKKEFICAECYSELKVENKNFEIPILCPNCKQLRLPSPVVDGVY
jgi:hypothetical protein